MADDKAFSHITVSADDEDDFVIHAGVRPGAKAAQQQETLASPVVESSKPAPAQDPSLEEALRSEPAAEASVSVEPSSTEAAQGDARSARRKSSEGEAYRETQLEDLKGAPMPTAQKVVIIVAALAVIGFIVYYAFLR